MKLYINLQCYINFKMLKNLKNIKLEIKDL